MINTKLFDMRNKVKAELEHIYKGDFYQNLLRHYYFNIRMASLGSKADKNKYPNDPCKILETCIEEVQKFAKQQNSDFRAKYNDEFFKQGRKK